MGNSRAELINDLRERLRGMETAQRPGRTAIPASAMGLARILPDRGFEWGTLIEWLSEGDGHDAATLALVMSARLMEREGGALVVIDGNQEFYPPAATGLGIPLERTVMVQPGNGREALWALEHSLRSRAVAVALGWVGGLNDRVYRRLQLAAEAGGSLGFLLRPASCRADPSWAEVRLLVQALPLASQGKRSMVQSSGRRLRVEVLHCRGGAGGGAVELELHDEAGHVRLAARLAHPAPRSRASGA